MSFKHPVLPFFLLPFFMMSGVALQSAGLYLCLVVWMFIAGDRMAPAPRRAVLSTASLLIVAYLTPIVMQSLLGVFENPLRSCVVDPPRVLSCDVSLKGWFKSPVSTALLGLGAGWSLFIFSRRRTEKPRLQSDVSGLVALSDDAERLRAFARGLLVASILLFGYCLYQHLTGYSLLLKSRLLAPEHQMGNGRYRVFGFYGHPLSMAGAALVWLSCGVWGVWTEFRRRNRSSGLPISQWILVLLIHASLVYMSGGRTAFAVAILFVAALAASLLVAVVVTRRLRTAKGALTPARIKGLLLAAGAGCAVLFASFVTLVSSESLQKLVALTHTRGNTAGTAGDGLFGDRALFWQVYLAMWRDAPFFGQGFFAVQHGVRTQYYVQEGFADLRDKFGAHNIFLEILGTMGLVGFFVYLLLCVLLWLNLKILTGRSEQRQFVLGVVALAFIANLLHGFTQNTFFDSAVSACYLALVGFFIVPSVTRTAGSDSETR